MRFKVLHKETRKEWSPHSDGAYLLIDEYGTLKIVTDDTYYTYISDFSDRYDMDDWDIVFDM